MCAPENANARFAVGHAALFLLQILFCFYSVLSKAVFAFTSVEVMLASRLISGTIQTLVLSRVDPNCRAINAKPFKEVWPTGRALVKECALAALAMIINTYLYLLGVRFCGPLIAS